MNFDLDFETVTGRCTVQKISQSYGNESEKTRTT